MMCAMWPLLVEDRDLQFLDEPPAEIGEVIGGWTNNGANGLKRVPVSLRLMIASIGVMGGLALGVVGFFVIAGIYEHRGGHVEANWFLDALGGGAALGLLAALPWALRKPKRLAMFVGKSGCAMIAQGTPDMLLFRDVEDMRDRVSSMSYRGIRTTARELHVRRRGGRERLWYVSRAKDDGRSDAQYQFGEAVLRAFAAFRADRT